MGYIRQVLFTYGLRLAATPIGLAYGIIVARTLGPEEFGILVAIGAAIMTATQIGNLGIPTAVLRTAAGRPELTGVLIANARVVGAVTGSLALLALALFSYALPGSLGAIPRPLLLLAGLSLPLTFGSAQFQAIALGRRRVRHYNYIEALNRGLLLVAALLMLFVFRLGLRGMVGATVVLAAIQWGAWHLLFDDEGIRLAPDFSVLRGMAGVSSRAYVTILLTFLVLRSDMLLINGLLGPKSLGIYGVAVQGADALILLPALAGLILFPRIAAQDDDRSAAMTALVSRHTALLMAVLCVGTALAAFWVVPFLFGEPYRGAAIALWVLLPGVLCYSLQAILQNDLSGRGYPAILPAAWGVALAVNVLGNIALLPHFGVAAAAASSSLAYALAYFMTLRHWTRRFPSIPVRDLLLPRAEELRTLGTRLMTGVAGTPPAGPATP
jgi:O-antigen/teichoic acid export membrane protein